MLSAQTEDNPQGFVHPVPLHVRIDTEPRRIGHQGARAHAQHHPPPGEVIQPYHAVRDHEGMVIGQADDARTQLDVPGAVRGDADENLRAGEGFSAGTLVLTDPHFIKPQGAQPLHELQVPGWESR